jgi:zinc protease
MKKLLLAALVAASALSPALGESNPAAALPGLSRGELPNGLEVYAYRDGAIPLARVQLVFRAGAIAQAASSAGLVRLYERLLFGGREPGSSTQRAAQRAALASIGASASGGGTGIERVDYWVTVPASRAPEAMAYWAGVFSSPKRGLSALGASELDEAKESVLREIAAAAANPEAVYEAGLSRQLFPKYPWRRDPLGSEAAVRAATLDSLKEAVGRFLVPNNAALIVSGDIDPGAVMDAAREAFGDWARGPDPWSAKRPRQPRPGPRRPTWLVFADPAMPEGGAGVELRYRGPDLAFEPAAGYAADLWCALAAPAGGRFKTALAAAVPGLAVESVVAAYASQSEGGWLSISGSFSLPPAAKAGSGEAPSAVDEARAFKERARGYEITAMKADASYFSAAEYEAARNLLLGDRALSADSAEGMADALAFWWAAASVDYLAGYPAAIAAAGPKEVSAFLDTYVLRNLEVVALRMNPADVEREKRSLAGSGFETINSTNAFWWKR